MAEILLVPLDDRPCNRLFPVSVAKTVGQRVISPPRALLGNFSSPGKPGELAVWLQDHAANAAAAVVSIDMLAFGGLMASRSPEVSLARAREHLSVLRRIKEAHPKLPIYAASVIMRLSISADSPERIAQWRNIALFSQLVDRVERLGQERWAEALSAIRRQIPEHLLDDYLRARERNHSINRETVSLAADGVVDIALLLQEDAAPFGLHIPEQQEILSLAKNLAVTDRVSMCAGADEGGLVMLARAALKLNGWQPKASVIYGSEEGANRVSLYEDRPINDNLAAHAAACGVELARSARQADLLMLVHTPTSPQQEVAQIRTLSSRANVRQVNRLVRKAKDLLEAHQDIAIADIAYCNGADPVLVDALTKEGIFPQLAAYAAWNTSGNSLGAALAHGILRAMARRNGTLDYDRAQINFLFSRLVDDSLYQAKVRQETNEWLEEQGHSPLRLKEGKEEAENHIRKRLRPLARDVFNQYFKGKCVNGKEIGALRRLTLKLPWPRTFEIEATADIELLSD